MNSFSQQQVEEILDRATQKSADLTPAELMDVARQSNIPEWCVQAAIEEVKTKPSLSQPVQTDRSIAAESRGVVSRSNCRMVCPGFLLTGVMVVLGAVTSVVAGNGQFQSYEKTAHSALEAAANASTSSQAVQEIDRAIDWFESQGANQFQPPQQVAVSFEQLKMIESFLEERKNQQLSDADRKAIATTAAVIEDGYQKISAMSQIQKVMDVTASASVFGVCSFYLGLAVACQGKRRSVPSQPGS